MRMRGVHAPASTLWRLTMGGMIALGAAGCAQILGLDEWPEDDVGTTGGPGAGGDAGAAGAGAGGASSASGELGGLGGAGDGGPSCGDGLQNGPETDIDCGGDSCPPCEDGQVCATDADCASNTCGTDNTCVATEIACDPPGPEPTCNDCMLNGPETDVDCGGDSCRPCAAQKQCQFDGDCLSGNCSSSVCAPGQAGAACFTASDCAGATCAPGPCWTELCCQ